MRERDVKAYLLRRVKALGGEARKVRWEGRNAAPDWLVMLPAQWSRVHGRVRPPRHFFAELKRPKKGAEELQALEHRALRDYRIEIYVLNSIEAIDRVLGG